MKTCTRCKQDFESAAFCKNPRTKDGLNGWCRACVSAYKKTPAAMARKRELSKTEHEGNRRRAYWKNRRATDAVWREKDCKDQIARYRINKIAKPSKPLLTREEKLEHQRTWRKNNRDRILTREKARRAAMGELYREQGRMWCRRRKAIKRGLVHDFTLADWKAVLVAFSGKCAYCGTTGKMQQDHFWPQALGGGYTRSNIIPACADCNRRKNKRNPFDFLFRPAEDHGLLRLAQIVSVLHV